MRKLIDFSGGRSLLNNDLDAIQQQISALESMYGSLGPFVVSGCVLTIQSGTTYSLSAGVVYLNRRLYAVDAVGAVNLFSPSKMIRQASVLQITSRTYALLATTKPGIEQVSTEIVDASLSANGEALFLLPAGMRSFQDALRQKVYTPNQVSMYHGNLATDFDGTGKGIGDLRGWQLMNGQPGYPDLRNKLVVGAGTSFSIGDTDNITRINTPTIEAYAVAFMTWVGTSTLYKT